MDIIYVNMFTDSASKLEGAVDSAIANGTVVIGHNTHLNENKQKYIEKKLQELENIGKPNQEIKIQEVTIDDMSDIQDDMWNKIEKIKQKYSENDSLLGSEMKIGIEMMSATAHSQRGYGKIYFIF